MLPACAGPSKLCKDIFELEKDFKYNLILLKIRDTELERCKTQNAQLMHELHTKTHTTTLLQNQLNVARNELQEARETCTRLETNHQEKIQRLQDRLEELTQLLDQRQREHTVTLQRSKKEIQSVCEKTVQELRTQYEKDVAGVRQQLHLQMQSTEKIKMDLHEMITENLYLKSEIQKQKMDHVSKISILESELQTATSEKQTLNKQLESCQSRSSLLESEQKKSIAVKLLLEQKLEECEKNSRGKIQDLYNKEHNLKHELEAISMTLQKTLIEAKSVKQERNQLQNEFDQLSSQCEYLKAQTQETNCTNSNHRDIDIVLKQNAVLQEVVKAMRKERGEALDTQEMERKMERLEALVGQLKASMLNCCTANDPEGN